MPTDLFTFKFPKVDVFTQPQRWAYTFSRFFSLLGWQAKMHKKVHLSHKNTHDDPKLITREVNSRELCFRCKDDCWSRDWSTSYTTNETHAITFCINPKLLGVPSIKTANKFNCNTNKTLHCWDHSKMLPDIKSSVSIFLEFKGGGVWRMVSPQVSCNKYRAV